MDMFTDVKNNNIHEHEEYYDANKWDKYLQNVQESRKRVKNN